MMIRAVNIVSRDDPLLPLFKQLVRSYLIELGVDISFQGLEKEMEELPGKYGPDAGGCMFLLIDQSIDQQPIPVGCIALRDLGEGIAEVKRMYVDVPYRGQGHARRMMNDIITFAKQQTIEQHQSINQSNDQSINQSHRRYHKLRLDTLARLKSANVLYNLLGFKQIEPYNFNPIPDVLYFELDL